MTAQDDERAVSLDSALARTQRDERDEQARDLARQQQADEAVVRALAEGTAPTATDSSEPGLV